MPKRYGNNENINYQSAFNIGNNAVLLQDLSSSFDLTFAKSASIVETYINKCNDISGLIRLNDDLYTIIKNSSQRFQFSALGGISFSLYFFREVAEKHLAELGSLVEYLSWIEDDLGIEQDKISHLLLFLIERT